MERLRTWCVCGGTPETLGADYAYLLGIYLGDGYLVRARRTWKLRIVQDQRYLGLIGLIGDADVAGLGTTVRSAGGACPSPAGPTSRRSTWPAASSSLQIVSR